MVQATLGSSPSIRGVVSARQTTVAIRGSNPIVLRNQISEIESIEDLQDVVVTNGIDGASVVYNANTDQYEIRPLAAADLSGTLNIDGGQF